MVTGLLQRATGSMAFLPLVVWVMGCAQPPADRLSQAQQLMDSAKAAGAPEYAMEEWSRLEVAFDRAKEELANQEKVLAIFRSYAKADEMLKRVARDAALVGAVAANRKAEAKAAAESKAQEAWSALTSARKLLSRGSTGNNNPHMTDVPHELTVLQDAMDSVRRQIEEGDYAAAQVQAQMLIERAAAVSDDLRKKSEQRRGKKA